MSPPNPGSPNELRIIAAFVSGYSMAERAPQAAPRGAPHAAIIGASVSGLAAALALGLRGYHDHVYRAGRHADAARPPRRVRKMGPARRGTDAPQPRAARAARQTDQDARAGAFIGACSMPARKNSASPNWRAPVLPGAVLEPGDEDICFLACRRVVFEYLLRRYIAERHGVRIIEGATVVALLAERRTPPRVTGVEIQQESGASQTSTQTSSSMRAAGTARATHGSPPSARNRSSRNRRRAEFSIRRAFIA